MKIQCESCGELSDLTQFRTRDGELVVTCTACGVELALSATPATAPAAPAAKPPVPPPAIDAGASPPVVTLHNNMTCPKCEEVQQPAAACRRCGLSASRFTQYRANVADDAPPMLSALWAACEANRNDVSRHEAFLAAASSAEQFRYAAARYRGALRRRPDDPVVVKRLADVRRMAEAALAAASIARENVKTRKRPYRAISAVLALLLALGAVGFLYASSVREKQVDHDSTRTAPRAPPPPADDTVLTDDGR